MSLQKVLGLIALFLTFLLVIIFISSQNCILHNCKLTLADRIRAFENVRMQLNVRENIERLGGEMDLTPSESQVNELLMDFKLAEHKRLVSLEANAEVVAAAQQNETVVYDQMQRSPIFQMLRAMPKGGVLHVRDTDLCSIDCLIKYTHYDNLWICLGAGAANNSNLYKMLRFAYDQPKLQFSERASCDWLLLSELRRKAGFVLVDQTLRHRLLTVRAGLQDAFLNGLLTYEHVWAGSQHYGLEMLYADGVQYVEIRSSLPQLYDIYGMPLSEMQTIEIMHGVLNQFKQINSDFIGAKFIYAPLGNISDKLFDEHLQRASFLKRNFGQYFAGIDLSSLEANYRTLRDYAYKILAAQEEGMRFFYHGNLHSCGTAVGEQNLIDAVLLNVQRIGCGTTMALHPELARVVKSRFLPIEVSINAQFGGQLRLPAHFASSSFNECNIDSGTAYLFANGMPIVLVQHDTNPRTRTTMTNQFYITFMEVASKNADLRTLKQLGLNSLNWSAMPDNERQAALKSWQAAWEIWVEQMRANHNKVADVQNEREQQLGESLFWSN